MKKMNFKQYLIILIGIIVVIPNIVNAGACVQHANTTFTIQRNGSGCNYGTNCTAVTRANGASYGMRRYDVVGYQTYCMDPGAKAPKNGFTYTCRRQITPESNSEGPAWQAFDVAATWAYQYMVENGLISPSSDNRVIGELVFRWLELAAYQLPSPNVTSDGTLALFRRGPAAFSQGDSRVAIATNIYNSAVAVGNRILSGSTYEQLVEEGLIWGVTWDIKAKSNGPGGSTDSKVVVEVSPKGNAPDKIYYDSFTAECDNGVVCTITDRQVSGNTATLTVSVDRSKASGAYKMYFNTPYSDSRSASANIVMLQKGGYQSMLVIADSNLPVNYPNIPTTFHNPRIPWDDIPQCEEKNGKYYYDGKEVTSEDDMVKYSCPVYCKPFPDSTRTDDHYGWADIFHYGTSDNGGKHYFNKADYEKYCNTKCQIVDNIHHCGSQYMNDKNSPDDICSAEEYNQYCENGQKVCKHEGNKYYCKNGQVCDSNKFFEDCCDQLDPNSDDYQKYCSCGDADIKFIGACTEFNSSNEFLMNHVADTPDNAQLKFCLFSPNNHDKANNSYEMTDQNKIASNPYCKVSCIEDYEFKLPNSQYTLSGSYFTLETEVKGTRKCYINARDGYDGIDQEKFLTDLTNASKKLAKAQTKYNKITQAIANISSKERGCDDTTIYYTEKFTYQACTVNRSGVNINVSCSSTSVSKNAYTDGEESSCDCGSKGVSCCDDGEDGSEAGIKSSILGDDTLEGLKESIATYTKEINGILQSYDDCTHGWENNFKFDPLVQFEYDEPYQNMDGFNNKFEQVSKNTDSRNDYCTSVGDSYECDSQTFETYNQSYAVCSGGENASCTTSTRALSKDRFIIKSKSASAVYKPKNGFSVYTPLGTIALDRGNYVLYTGLCSGSDECLPIALNTHTGVFNFKFRFSQIGQFNDNNQVGRLVGEDKSVYNAVANQQEAGYVCHYVNNCPDCDYVCVGDSCNIDNDCGDNCTYVCQNCIFDGENSTFYYRTVSINKLFPNEREYGPNWNNEKGKYTKSVIEENGEEVYKEPEYSYTINAQQMNRIREFNKSVGDYLNAKMPNGEDSLTCHDLSSNGKNYQNIYCISSFLDTAGNTYFTENKRNDIWVLWPDSGYFTNSTKYSVVLGMGPAWK